MDCFFGTKNLIYIGIIAVIAVIAAAIGFVLITIVKIYDKTKTPFIKKPPEK